MRYVFKVISNDVRKESDTAGQDGTYNVKTPDSTDRDQVRYMLQVIEKSVEGRNLVRDTYSNLLRKSAGSGCSSNAGTFAVEVADMKRVRDNRAKLLQDLSAMPVDRIPEGRALLDRFTAAIRLSYQVNIEYVAWAERAQSSGCAGIAPSVVNDANHTEVLKEGFTNIWNSVVAPKFGVRTFTPGDI
ncbi:MAG: hypothetical protein Q4C71_00530 [Microbacteriaceae bacterium]|nr:hypothetical protein [Microbacteriaceae bacterium]